MQTSPLWPNGAPGALGNSDEHVPTLTAYLPEAGGETGTGNRGAIVVFPGGGYGGLASHEGEDYARFLNKHGIAAFVVKYRLGSDSYRHPRMLEDAARAVRTVRALAGQWNVDPARIGIIGSSAGGHLAATLATLWDEGNPVASDPVERVSSRPDLAVLCYPVITMGSITHGGSRDNLLGPNPPSHLIELLSAERQVNCNTPPCFVWHTWEDGSVPVEHSLLFVDALRRSGVRFALHLYERGGHGMGLADKAPFDNTHPWATELVLWLGEHGFI